MHPENTVLIVGGKLGIVRKAKALGLDVLYFQHQSQFSGEHLDLVSAAVLVDYRDLAKLRPLARAAHEAWGFASVLSLTEPGILPAATVNDMFGLAGTSCEVARRFMDKWLMRQRLAVTGTSSIAAAPVTGPESLSDFGMTHGYPFIVKPASGAGSVGVTLVDGAADIAPTWRRIIELRAMLDPPWTAFCTVEEFIMENYIPGPEYSVEAFSFAGRHVIVAITEKSVRAGSFVEIGHALPARIPHEVEEAIVQATTDFLDALELRDGPTHTEVRVGTAGPVVIESHNRVGGDRISELVEEAYGIDLDTYAIGWPFRLVEELPCRPRPKRAAATRFLVAEPGRVVRVEDTATARRGRDVIDLEVSVRVGDTVGRLRDSSGRLGQVVAIGADTDSAIEACTAALEELKIETRQEA
jgi:biotin carboxylase